jgi:hypothetical protein
MTAPSVKGYHVAHGALVVEFDDGHTAIWKQDHFRLENQSGATVAAADSHDGFAAVDPNYAPELAAAYWTAAKHFIAEEAGQLHDSEDEFSDLNFALTTLAKAAIQLGYPPNPTETEAAT